MCGTDLQAFIRNRTRVSREKIRSYCAGTLSRSQLISVLCIPWVKQLCVAVDSSTDIDTINEHHVKYLDEINVTIKIVYYDHDASCPLFHLCRSDALMKRIVGISLANQKLGLSHIDILCDTVSNICRLDLSSCIGFSESSLRRLLASVSGTLRELTLSGLVSPQPWDEAWTGGDPHPVSDDLVAFICSSSPQLKALCMAGCIRISAAGVASLVSLRHLEVLDLSRCFCVSADVLAPVLRSCTLLKRLRLYHCLKLHNLDIGNSLETSCEELDLKWTDVPLATISGARWERLKVLMWSPHNASHMTSVSNGQLASILNVETLVKASFGFLIIDFDSLDIFRRLRGGISHGLGSLQIHHSRFMSDERDVLQLFEQLCACVWTRLSYIDFNNTVCLVEGEDDRDRRTAGGRVTSMLRRLQRRYSELYVVLPSSKMVRPISVVRRLLAKKRERFATATQ